MPSKGDWQMKKRSSFLTTLAVIAACAASSCSSGNDEADINASLQRLVAAVNAKDINGIMAYYSPDESLLVFDAFPPRRYVGAAAYRKDWEASWQLTRAHFTPR
jgi:ketosteroid isomerase-like protein